MSQRTLNIIPHLSVVYYTCVAFGLLSGTPEDFDEDVFRGPVLVCMVLYKVRCKTRGTPKGAATELYADSLCRKVCESGGYRAYSYRHGFNC